MDRKLGNEMVQLQEQAKLPLPHWPSGISFDNCHSASHHQLAAPRKGENATVVWEMDTLWVWPSGNGSYGT